MSTAPELDIETIKKVLTLIETLCDTNAIDSLNQMKEMCNKITWKESNSDLEFILYLEKSLNQNLESIKLKLDTYKVTLKLKLERLELYLNALKRDKESLKKVLDLIKDFAEYNLMDTCSFIGNLMKNISWKEDNPEYIRNKHGFRSRWIKKPNKLNSDGARINFEMLSHLKHLNIQDDWIQNFVKENFDFIKSYCNFLSTTLNLYFISCFYSLF